MKSKVKCVLTSCNRFPSSALQLQAHAHWVAGRWRTLPALTIVGTTVLCYALQVQAHALWAAVQQRSILYPAIFTFCWQVRGDTCVEMSAGVVSR